VPRNPRRVQLAIGLGALSAVALAAPAASADVVGYSCPSTGCVVQVGTGLVTGGGAGGQVHSGKAGNGAQAALVALGDTEGIAGPGIAFGQAEVGKTSTATEGTFLFIGSAGGVQEFADASSGPGTASADASYYRYNLVNGENAGATAGTANHVTGAGGGACAIDLIGGACIGVNGSTGPAGTTVTPSAGIFTVTSQEVYVTVDSGKGRPTTVTSNVPLLP
jgi:hypothetical protein